MGDVGEPWNLGGGSPTQTSASVRAHSPDTMSRSPKRWLLRKTSSIAKSPGYSTLTTSGAPSGAGASIEQVPPPPLQDDVDDRKKAAKEGAKERTATATNSSPKPGEVLQSPAGTNTLRQSLAEDSSSEESQDDLKVLRLRARSMRRKLCGQFCSDSFSS